MTTYQYKGEQLTVDEIAAREGVKSNTVQKRIQQHGRATKVRPKLFDYGSEKLPAREIAEREGITKQAVHERAKQKEKLPTPRGRKKHTCSVCGGEGHNALNCGFPVGRWRKTGAKRRKP